MAKDIRPVEELDREAYLKRVKKTLLGAFVSALYMAAAIYVGWHIVSVLMVICSILWARYTIRLYKTGIE